MSVTYGFYNSLNGDRKYDAGQLSSLFAGIITDGVLANYKNGLQVLAADTPGMSVVVDTGRAWFRNTWTNNDAKITLSIDTADVSWPRIDLVIIDINTSTRTNAIQIKKGTPNVSPAAPSLINTTTNQQYALAEVYVAANATLIAQTNITDKRGSTGTPFAAAPLVTVTTESLLSQWQSEFSALMSSDGEAFSDWFDTIKDIVIDPGTAAQLGQCISALSEGRKVFTNLTVASTAWNSYSPAQGSEEEKLKNLGYTYKAMVQLNGMQTNDILNYVPDVVFSLPDIDSTGASIANEFQTYFTGGYGGICLYAEAAPSSAITILSVTLVKEVTFS